MVEKCVSEKMQCFGPLLKRVRKMVVKYRMSSKSKTFLVTVFEKRLPGFIPSRWYILSFLVFCSSQYSHMYRWTDIIMLEVFIEAANHPEQPLYHLSVHMGWGITFSREEVKELEKLMSVMGPMEKLFCRLNSEKSSVIHLVYPTVKVNCTPIIN